MNSFFRELRQRKVYRVALGHSVVEWLVVQVGAPVMALYQGPSFTNAVALGFPVALTLDPKPHC
jgi:hypothetical protein